MPKNSNSNRLIIAFNYLRHLQIIIACNKRLGVRESFPLDMNEPRTLGSFITMLQTEILIKLFF
jgi:hypothetical protein